jgi:hypothetical protein
MCMQVVVVVVRKEGAVGWEARPVGGRWVVVMVGESTSLPRKESYRNVLLLRADKRTAMTFVRDCKSKCVCVCACVCVCVVH